MTRDQWLQRFIGAYQVLSDDESAAETAAAGFVNEQINTVDDCPVESAKDAWKDDAVDELSCEVAQS